MKYLKTLKAAGLALGTVGALGLASVVGIQESMAESSNNEYIVAGPREMSYSYLSCDANGSRYSVHLQLQTLTSTQRGVLQRSIGLRLGNCQDKYAFTYSLTINGNRYVPFQSYTANPEWTNVDKQVKMGMLRDVYSIFVTQKGGTTLVPYTDYKGQLTIEVTVREIRIEEKDRHFTGKINCQVKEETKEDHSFLKCPPNKYIIPLEEVVKETPKK